MISKIYGHKLNVITDHLFVHSLYNFSTLMANEYHHDMDFVQMILLTEHQKWADLLYIKVV